MRQKTRCLRSNANYNESIGQERRLAELLKAVYKNVYNLINGGRL